MDDSALVQVRQSLADLPQEIRRLLHAEAFGKFLQKLLQ